MMKRKRSGTYGICELGGNSMCMSFARVHTHTNINIYLLFIKCTLNLISQEQTETRLNDPIDEQSKISL